jgi:hypothetical protein
MLSARELEKRVLLRLAGHLSMLIQEMRDNRDDFGQTVAIRVTPRGSRVRVDWPGRGDWVDIEKE